MKYKSGHFCQISRSELDRLAGSGASAATKWLYVVLVELEHKYTGRDEDWFFRSLDALATDSGLSIWTTFHSLRWLKKEKFIHTWQTHLVDSRTKKKSEQHITAIRILDPDSQ